MTAPVATPQWIEGEFLLATDRGALKRKGLLYGHLALERDMSALDWLTQPRWFLTHLGSGHVICDINAFRPQALALATLIADAGDWSFDGLEGWQNQDPQLMDKVNAIIVAHRALDGGPQDMQQHGVAREIAMKRE